MHPQSRGLVPSVNLVTRTDSVVGETSTGRAAGRQPGQPAGAVAIGDVLVGRGSEPYFSESSAGGQPLYDAHLDGSYESDRAYRFPWTARRRVSPRSPRRPRRRRSGDRLRQLERRHQTTAWRVPAGSSPSSWQPVISATRSGFETRSRPEAERPDVAVQALGEGGNVLATSATIRG